MAVLIGHVDADCFYCSAERVRFPWLRGVPLGVLGNQGACVIAKSYEMKAKGVKTGEPIWDAKKKCPDALFLKRDFRWYEVLSQLMLEVVRSHSDLCEWYSVDEFFFRISDQDPQQAAEKLRQDIWEKVGVPVTVGIGRTRTLAKLISDTAKPFGAKALTRRTEERDLLQHLPVSEISGIAGRRAARLNKCGIFTCLDYVNSQGAFLRKLLTIVGEQLWYELNGISIFPIHSTRIPHQTLSRGGSLGGKVTNPTTLYAWLVRNLERLIEELHYHQVYAGRLSLFLSYEDAPTTSGEGPLDCPTDRFDLLLDSARIALRKAYLPQETVTHMHLVATDLKKAGFRQGSLFEPDNEQAQRIAEMKRQINHEVGRFALRSAATLPLVEIYADVSNEFDICDIRGKTCF